MFLTLVLAPVASSVTVLILLLGRRSGRPAHRVFRVSGTIVLAIAVAFAMFLVAQVVALFVLYPLLAGL